MSALTCQCLSHLPDYSFPDYEGCANPRASRIKDLVEIPMDSVGNLEVNWFIDAEPKIQLEPEVNRFKNTVKLPDDAADLKSVAHDGRRSRAAVMVR